MAKPGSTPTRTREATRHEGIRKVTTATTTKFEVRVRMPSGRRITRTFDRLDDAKQFRTESRALVQTGRLTDARTARLTLAGWLADPRWQAHRATLRPRTQDIYDAALKRAVAFFGELPLVRIDDAEVRRFQAHLAASLNPGGVHQALRVLRTCFAHMVEAKILGANPAAKFRVRDDTRPEHRDERRAITEAEAGRILAAAPPRWVAMIATALTLGLRFGELAGLRRGDIDLEAGEIRITKQSYYQGGELLTTAPKTDYSVRTIPIPEQLRSILERHLDEYAQPGAQGIAFPSTSDRVIDRHTFRLGTWNPTLKRAGVRHAVFHAARVSSTTWLLDAGVNPKTVSEIQGHGSTGVTLAVYARATAASKRDAAERVGAVLGAALETPSNVVPIRPRGNLSGGRRGAEHSVEANS